jgi:hypothetical protein
MFCQDLHSTTPSVGGPARTTEIPRDTKQYLHPTSLKQCLASILHTPDRNAEQHRPLLELILVIIGQGSLARRRPAGKPVPEQQQSVRFPAFSKIVKYPRLCSFRGSKQFMHLFFQANDLCHSAPHRINSAGFLEKRHRLVQSLRLVQKSSAPFVTKSFRH